MTYEELNSIEIMDDSPTEMVYGLENRYYSMYMGKIPDALSGTMNVDYFEYAIEIKGQNGPFYLTVTGVGEENEETMILQYPLSIYKKAYARCPFA